MHINSLLTTGPQCFKSGTEQVEGSGGNQIYMCVTQNFRIIFT